MLAHLKGGMLSSRAHHRHRLPVPQALTRDNPIGSSASVPPQNIDRSKSLIDRNACQVVHASGGPTLFAPGSPAIPRFLGDLVGRALPSADQKSTGEISADDGQLGR